MPLEIKSRDDLIIVLIHILHNPGLSLDAKGAAGVMYSYADLHCSTVELAKLLGVDEKRAKELIHELQNAGYENIFHLSEETEIHDQATGCCAANFTKIVSGAWGLPQQESTRGPHGALLAKYVSNSWQAGSPSELRKEPV